MHSSYRNILHKDKFKKILEHFDSKFMMIFLMELNESHTHLRVQILLMNQISYITKVFALIIQEEHQRSIYTNNSTFPHQSKPQCYLSLPMNFNKKLSCNHKKDNRLMCTHCGFQNHVVDKCYKLRNQNTSTLAENKTSSHQPSFSKHTTHQISSQAHCLNKYLTDGDA